MKSFLDGRIELYSGDCREVLKGLADNSVDSVVTDPPYELGFMSRKWDATGILEGLRCVLVEREEEYLADIERRIGLIGASKQERKQATKPATESAGPLFESTQSASLN